MTSQSFFLVFFMFCTFSSSFFVAGQDDGIDIYIEVPSDLSLSTVALDDDGSFTNLVDSRNTLKFASLTCSAKSTQCSSCCLQAENNIGGCYFSGGCQPLKCQCAEPGCVDACPNSYQCSNNMCVPPKLPNGENCMVSSDCISNNCTAFKCAVKIPTCKGPNRDTSDGSCDESPDYYCNEKSECTAKSDVSCTYDYQCLSSRCFFNNCVPPDFCVDASTPILHMNGSYTNASQVRLGDDLYGLDGEKNTVVLILQTEPTMRRMVGMNGGPKFFTPAHIFVNPAENPVGVHVYDPEEAAIVSKGMLPPFSPMIAGQSQVSLYKEGEFKSILIESMEVETRVAHVFAFLTVSNTPLQSYVSHGIVSGENRPLSMPTLYIVISIVFDRLETLPISKMNDPIPCYLFFTQLSAELKEEMMGKEGVVSEKSFESEWRDELRSLAKKWNSKNPLVPKSLADFFLPSTNSFTWLDNVDPKVAKKMDLVNKIHNRFMEWLL